MGTVDAAQAAGAGVAGFDEIGSEARPTEAPTSLLDGYLFVAKDDISDDFHNSLVTAGIRNGSSVGYGGADAGVDHSADLAKVPLSLQIPWTQWRCQVVCLYGQQNSKANKTWTLLHLHTCAHTRACTQVHILANKFIASRGYASRHGACHGS